MPTINANTDAISIFARKLKKAYPESARALRSSIRAAGKLVADDAKVRAADFSTSIPGSIRSSASSNTATIKAGNAKTPLAALYERPGGWRHPVFGNRNNWAAQPNAPKRFLHEALDAQTEPAKKAIADAVMAAIDEVLSEAN